MNNKSQASRCLPKQIMIIEMGQTKSVSQLTKEKETNPTYPTYPTYSWRACYPNNNYFLGQSD